MIFSGAIVNALAILVVGLIGNLIRNRVPERLTSGIMKAVGLAVLYIGISGVLKNENVMLLVISMVIGTLIGELIDIDKQMIRLGNWLEKKLPKGRKYQEGQNSFSKGFVPATILFCVGSMAIVGSMNSGFSADHTMLYTKSILDGTTSLFLAGTLGIGVAFSSIPILLYEGTLTLIAFFVGSFMTDIMITEMSAIGSLLIAAIGFNLLDFKQIKVANMIPAMFIPCVYFPLMAIL